MCSLNSPDPPLGQTLQLEKFLCDRQKLKASLHLGCCVWLLGEAELEQGVGRWHGAALLRLLALPWAHGRW